MNDLAARIEKKYTFFDHRTQEKCVDLIVTGDERKQIVKALRAQKDVPHE